MNEIREQLEVAAYILQLSCWKSYYGPAPPYHILKNEPICPGDYSKRLLCGKEKEKQLEARPIGPDGFPLPRPKVNLGKSKLAL